MPGLNHGQQQVEAGSDSDSYWQLFEGVAAACCWPAYFLWELVTKQDCTSTRRQWQQRKCYLVVIFSRPGCKYCVTLNFPPKRHHPLAEDGRASVGKHLPGAPASSRHGVLRRHRLSRGPLASGKSKPNSILFHWLPIIGETAFREQETSHSDVLIVNLLGRLSSKK